MPAGEAHSPGTRLFRLAVPNARPRPKRFRDAGSPTSNRVLIGHAAPNPLLRLVNNLAFALAHLGMLFRPKLLYTLTPPSWIQNTGDQAQVVAILAWLRKFFPDRRILEMNQSESGYFLPALRLLVRGDDLVFLHSGGNLGDRYMGTERPRRAIIRAFPRNRIVSLPQTIAFGDSESGRAEQQASAAIYSAHPDFSLICRDRISARTAVGMFPHAKLFCLPDFVLSLPPFEAAPAEDGPPILICRRIDRESVYGEEAWQALAARLPLASTFFDTRFDAPIPPAEREARLAETLRRIASHRVIVTDRFHAIVFAILCHRPCVALPTIDHKVRASRYWFRGVLYAETLDDVPALVAQGLERGFVAEEDWNALYFDRLPAQLGLVPKASVAAEASGAETALAGQWRAVSPWQKPGQFHEEGDTLRFSADAASGDEWCFVSAGEGWRDFDWSFEACRETAFREFAFNFRYRDFDNRYRYRFEGGRLYFDKKRAGRWHNHLASVPFEMAVGAAHAIRIEARGEHFSCSVDGRLVMENSDPDIADGGVAIVLWKTDAITPLRAWVRGARIALPAATE